MASSVTFAVTALGVVLGGAGGASPPGVMAPSLATSASALRRSAFLAPSVVLGAAAFCCRHGFYSPGLAPSLLIGRATAPPCSWWKLAPPCSPVPVRAPGSSPPLLPTAA